MIEYLTSAYFFMVNEYVYDSACNLLSKLPFLCHVMSCHLCFNMLLLLYVAGPHVKQPLADELSWVNMF